MAPGAKSKFGVPVFEPEVFRKQMYWIAESTCDIVGTLGASRSNSTPPQWFDAPPVIRRPPSDFAPPPVISRPGNCAPLSPPLYAPALHDIRKNSWTW